MKRDKNKLIGAKFDRGVTRFCLLTSFMFYIGFHSILCAQSVSIWPVEISFNYEAGSTNDAIDIQKNASTGITVPEYKKDVKNENCAYIRSQSNRKIKVKF